MEINNTIPLVYPDSHDYDRINRKLIRNGRERTKLIVNQEALQFIHSIKGKVAVVSINGKLRSGKSYILSRFLGSNNAFNLGSTTMSETFGIWISTALIPANGFNIILLDCEGFGSTTGADSQSDQAILVLSCLLSSTFIYNNTGVVNSNDLEVLNIITKLNDKIRLEEGKSLIDGNEIVRYMPTLIWLFRDSHLIPVDSSGIPRSLEDYLMENVLKLSTNTNISDTDMQKNYVRRSIISFFRKIRAYSLPFPSEHSHITRHMDKVKDSQLNPEFITQRDKVTKSIIESIEPKMGYNGNHTDGQMLSILIQNYTNIINRPDGIPSIGSSWEMAIKIVGEKVTGDALDLYNKRMNQEVLENEPMEFNQLIVKHKMVMKEVNKNIMDSFGHLASPVELEQVIENVSRHTINFKSSRDGASEIVVESGLILPFIQRNKESSIKQCNHVLQPIGDEFKLKYLLGNIFPFTTIIDEYGKLETRYYQLATGPMKNDVIQQFYQYVISQESMIYHLQQTSNLITLKEKGLEQSLIQQRQLNSQIEENNQLFKQQDEQLKESCQQLEQVHKTNVDHLNHQIKIQESESLEKLDRMIRMNKQDSDLHNANHQRRIQSLNDQAKRLDQEIKSVQSKRGFRVFGIKLF